MEITEKKEVDNSYLWVVGITAVLGLLQVAAGVACMVFCPGPHAAFLIS